ncbi:OmpA family protein [Flavobacterium sp. 9R]|uniref:OmpA family protein n=1 Tax=Flavobacterium sp. 9R TaxID=2653143 RepID=UPI0012F0B8BF|nr:OmpA family protein [Flavobacterium sp. 9R]VXB66494.1 OmpA family protein [Flavobacterium sp. 9R]
MIVRCFLLWCSLNFYTLSAQDKLVLFFNSNEDVINEESQKNFNTWLYNAKEIEVTNIHGYCDSIDVKIYNMHLSKRRVDNVLALLKTNKVMLSKNIQFSFLGENFLQSKILSENRKVEILFHKVQPTTAKNEEYKKSAIELNLSKAYVGDLLKLDNINFLNLSDQLLPESKPALLELISVMKKTKDLEIEIQGHICCQKKEGQYDVSEARAKRIYDILIENGIKKERLSYKGFGSKKPIYPLPEKDEYERIANRRVEILIVKK